MRFVVWIIAAILGLAALLFAVANRQQVALGFWPLPDQLELPLFLVVLLALVGGFVIGWIAEWFGAGRHRTRARRYAAETERLRQEVRRLETELREVREVASRDVPPPPVPTFGPSGTAPRTIAAGSRR